MLSTLKRHPFPVVARFDRVVAVSFAFPEEVLRAMVPRGLAIDSYEGLGFVTVALVWTRKLRPAGFGEFLGRDFFLSGTRIFTRLVDESGRRLRGLKIIRSETDKRTMVWAGTLLVQRAILISCAACQNALLFGWRARIFAGPRFFVVVQIFRRLPPTLLRRPRSMRHLLREPCWNSLGFILNFTNMNRALVLSFACSYIRRYQTNHGKTPKLKWALF